jgi:drug/metabolite transporter (DMT)-like permease
MWLFYALIAGLFYTGSNLITRRLLKNDTNDAWAFSFFFSAVGALVSLPFMLVNLKISSTLQPWLIMFIVGILIVVQNLFNFASAKYIAPSISGSITKFRLIWVMLLGIIILHETSNNFKILGTVFTVLSGLIIMKQLVRPKDFRGILYAFLATVFYAIVIILYKFLFTSFNTPSLTFFIFFIPMFLNLLIMPDSLKRIIKLAKENSKMVLVGCGMGGLANLAMNQGLSMGEASKTLVIIESFLVITLIGEHLILKERENVIIKIIAVIFATLGAVFIRLS